MFLSLPNVTYYTVLYCNLQLVVLNSLVKRWDPLSDIANPLKAAQYSGLDFEEYALGAVHGPETV